MLRPLFLGSTFSFAALLCALMVARGLPNAGQIAFQSNVAGDEDILLVDVRTAAVVNLTRAHTGNQTSPSWSPDGARIAYEYANLGTRAVSAIYTMNAYGEDLRRIFRGTAAQPTWSPDGRYISFITVQAVYIANADGSTSRVMREDEFFDYNDYLLRSTLASRQPESLGTIVDARWSPDRRWITFTFWNGNTTQGYSLDGDCLLPCTSPAQPLPNTERARAVMLSDTGRHVVFECRVGERNGICVMNHDGSDLRQVVISARGVRSIAPVWRP